MPTSQESHPWHQAVVFAVTGEHHPELGLQPTPDLDAVEQWLRADGRLDDVRRRVAARRAAGDPWPWPLPAGLTVPPAQLSAAVHAVRLRLGLLGAVSPPAAARALSDDEQRLLRDVPPHHGS